MLKLPSINILVSVDTATLSALLRDSRLAPGTVEHPTLLDDESQTGVLVTLTTQSCLVPNTDSEVVLRAAPGSQLGWTISGFDSNIDYTVYFYCGTFVFYPKRFVTPRIEDLVIATNTSTIYIPPGANPEGAPESVDNTIQRSYGPAIDVGERFWAILQFVVVDNSHGQVLGYFRWTPRFRVESLDLDALRDEGHPARDLT